MSAIVGIDPDRKGWLVGVDSDGIVWAGKMPDTLAQLRDVLEQHEPAFVYVEQQSTRPGQKGAATNMRNYGGVLGVLTALRIRFQEVRPQEWQKVMLRGCGKSEGIELKRTYTGVAERLFPGVAFRGPQGGMWDGKAAAALIAEYGRRQLNGSDE